MEIRKIEANDDRYAILMKINKDQK